MSSSVEKEPEYENSEGDTDTRTLTQEKVKTKKPNLYRVILLNDDYTPMDFVVWLIQTLFHKSLEEATLLMLEVHHKGQGMCGVYPYDIAKTKISQVKELALKHQHPLECIMEIE